MVAREPQGGVGPIHAGPWPAAQAATELLVRLGLTRKPSAGELSLGGYRAIAATTAEQDWLESGIAHLTGRDDGAPLRPHGHPATTARGAGLALELITAGTVRVDGARLLGQRVSHLDLRRRGDRSANGSARLLRAADGWFALNLPRLSDIELIPALVEGGADEPWNAVRTWARTQPIAVVEARAIMLGLAIGVLGEALSGRTPWQITRLQTAQPLRRPPLVVNLGSLWAAPLCAHLLSLAGANVIDVESPDRPDGAREGTPAFYRDLHQGHRLDIVDLNRPRGRTMLSDLIEEADVVVTASRARALRNLRVNASLSAANRPRVWVAITGHGAAVDRIAFGDDAAVAGGLVATDGHGPVFVGDAIADPMTGLLAALAASACLRAGGSWIVDINLRDVAMYAASH